MEDESDSDFLALFLSCKPVEEAKFEGATNTQELFACAEELVLSQPYDVKAVEVVGTAKQFRATYEANILTSTDLENFIEIYGCKNDETLRIAKNKDLTSRSSYSLVMYYRCQHDTRGLTTREIEEILARNP